MCTRGQHDKNVSSRDRGLYDDAGSLLGIVSTEQLDAYLWRCPNSLGTVSR